MPGAASPGAPVSSTASTGPPPDVDVDRFVDAVAAVAATTRAEVAIGCGDPEVLALSHYRGRLPARVPLASDERVVRAIDKLSLVSEAAAAGIAVPETVIADDRAIAAWRGPAVVKARLHWEPGLQASGGWASARFVPEGVSPAAAVQEVVDAGRSPVLQRPIDGISSLWRPCVTRRATSWLSSSNARRTPGHRGRGSAPEHTRCGPIPSWSTRSGDCSSGSGGSGWCSFSSCARPGPAHLIDLNGRPYGSLALALAAGLPATRPVGGRPRRDQAPGARSPEVCFGAPGRLHWLGGDLVVL